MGRVVSNIRRGGRIVAGIAGRGPRERALRRAVAGRIVLVTGASEGIGAATARRLGAAGATVLLVARTAARLEQVRDEIIEAGGTAFVHPANLSSPESAQRLAAELIREYRRVDVVVSNAGRSIRRSLTESADRFHDFTRTIDVNYLGPVALLLGLLPAMRAAGRGHLVSVSTAGLATPAPSWGAYLGSKAAFDVWLRCAAPELRLDGVTVSTVYCGLVRTRMSAPTRAFRRVPAATPDEAAALVCRAVASHPRTVWSWWARLGEPLVVAFKGSFERLLALHLRWTRASAGPRALARAGLLGPARLLRAAYASRRYGATLAAAFAAGPPDGLALVDADGELSRADLDRAAQDCARHLATLADVERVGLACAPGRGFVIAALALGRLGVDTVLLPPDTPASALPELLAAQGIAALVQDGRYPTAPVPSWHWSGPPEPVPARRGRSRPGRLTVLTSGSTGAPKAVQRRLPLRVLLGPVGSHLRLVPLRPGRPILLAAAPHHGYGLAYLAAGLTLGAPVLLPGALPPGQVLELARRYRAEVLVGLPLQLRRLAAAAGTGNALPGLRAVISGAAPLPVELHARLVQVFGDVVYNLYGTTEAGWAALATPKDLAAAPGTVGRPPRGVTLRVHDPSGAPLPPGEVGEVHVTGWLPGRAAVATGDLGHLDPVGRLLLHGRRDDMIISGGVNVYPQPVAAVIAAHPDVAEVCVDTVTDEEYGQRLRARVRLRTGAALTGDQLRDWLRERLPPAQRPRDIELTASPD